MAAKGLGPQLKAFINSPTGPRTTHFWWVTHAERAACYAVCLSQETLLSRWCILRCFIDLKPCAIALQGTSSKLGCAPGCSLQ